jgi:hypothetical protein
MAWSYFFPTQMTFFSVLYYIFLFYVVAFIIFNIYIYVNDLEYEINCKNNEKCMHIQPKHKHE